MAERVPLGDMLDKLGVRSGIAPDDLVTDAMVLLKVLEPDGSVRLAFAWSEGMSWIERLGMVTAAQAVEMPPSHYGTAEDGA